MKKFKTIVIMALFLGLMSGAASCTVYFAKDNGKHKGWYKNSRNPHHPKKIKPGKSKNWMDQ
jgi:hypothetical protein